MSRSIANRVLRELRAAARHKAPTDRSPPSGHILLGPVVQKPLDAQDGVPEFYFAIVGGTEQTFATMSVGGAERDLPTEFRLALIADLISQRPIVIHDMADELELARWAAAIWPNEETARILAAVRREREQASAEARQ